MSNIPAIELLSPLEIQACQFQKVKSALQYLESRSPFYQQLFRDHKLSSGSVQSWQDFTRIPTTSKDDLQVRNWDFLCVPKSEIVEYTSTSGTLGKPVTIGLTKKDMQRLAYNESISFACADGSSDDLYQLMLTLDRQFMAGIAYYEGIRKLDAGLVRVGPGQPALQWETIQRLNPTTLVGVPSFIVKLIEFAAEHKIDVNKSSIRKAICIGENIRTPELTFNTIGKFISDRWNIQLYGTYASTEMQTAFTECTHGHGGHHHPELIYVEILDDDGNALENDAEGEVTITSLDVEGMPLLRYRTGDIASIHREPCVCGRNTWRMGPVVGRKQQMIKLKGTTLYPPSVFEILQQVQGIRDYVVEAYTGDLQTDELRIYALVADDQEREVERLLIAAFQSRLRVVPQIVFGSASEIESLQSPAGGRKIKKFVDRRGGQ